MKCVQLVALGLAVVAGSPAAAQQRSPAFGPRVTLPSHPSPFGGSFGGRHGRGHGFPVFVVVERPLDYARDERVVVIREVVRDAGPPPPSAGADGPPPRSREDQREPYMLGKSYASLPGGCMKMIEGGESYYWCSGGEWYRAVGTRFKAVARP